MSVLVPRPSRNAPEVRAAAIASLAGDCAEWSDGTGAEQWIAMLDRVVLNANGYEIAKELDRYHSVVGINADLVEILDSASSYLWTAHERAVEAWVAEHDVKPSLEIGQRVSYRHWVGVITGAVPARGCYLMTPDGEEEKFANGGGMYAAYEECSPEQPQ